MGATAPLPKSCTSFRAQTLTVAGAGFETMAGAQKCMMEDATRIASRDQASLDQVQQTAAKGEAHVQGKSVCPHIHLHAAALDGFHSSGSCACSHWVLLNAKRLLCTLLIMVARASIQVVIRVPSCRFLQTADPGYCSTGRAC